MIPSKHYLPIIINHAFPYEENDSLCQKKAVVTSYLIGIIERGFGGIVTNVSFNNYTLDEEEWEVFAFIADECERLGLRLWIYDENGYPSGSAGGLTIKENPDFEAIGVVMIKRVLAPGEREVIELPRGHEHFLFAGVYSADSDGNLVLNSEGRCSLVSEVNCLNSTEPVIIENTSHSVKIALVFVKRKLYEGTHAVHNVWESRRCIDLTNPDAVRAFLRNTYDKYYKCIPEHFAAGASSTTPPIGSVEAIFTDEPSLLGCYMNAGLFPECVHDEFDEDIPLYPVLSYGRDVGEEYSARYGRDLFADLAEIFLGEGEIAKNIRYDYYTLISDLYEKSFFCQLSDWCENHAVSLSGHLLLEDDIKYHTVFEGNYFDLLCHMHYPGMDMLDSIPEHMSRGAYAFTPKLISSIAHHNNRPHVMSEASGYAQGNKVSADQMYASLAAQYAMGVDIFTFYYPFDFLESEAYTKYNHAIGRIGEVMAGEHRPDVLLYYPIETLCRHHRPSDAQYGTYDEWECRIKDSLWKIMNTLIHYQIDFDFVDADVLSRMESKDSRLVGCGGEEYSALILPPMEVTDEMARIFGETETKTAVIKYDDSLALSEEEIAAPIIECLGASRDVSASHPTSGVLRLTRKTKGGLATLIVNTNSDDVSIDLTLRGVRCPILYDPLDDVAHECECEEYDGGKRVKFSLKPYRCLIITEK